MAVIAQVSTQVRRFAAMGAFVAGGFALQVAFADHYVAAPLVQVLDCVRAGASAPASVSARPHFEEEIIVVAPTRHRPRSSTATGSSGGHASRAVQPAQEPAFNCAAAAASEAAL
jgi:hypothetical protein